ncbi:MAG: hypothetical protein K9G60_02970, partial [Pseudolabrys sp.]|nr:hypothetical protein [Pseudolabrys sp.]
MTGSIRAAMLLSDGFGGRGGIAKFNRDFLSALAVSGHIEAVYALPRVIPEPMNCDIPQAVAQTVAYDRQAAAGKLAYLRRLVRLLLGRAKIDVVVCGHLNLLPAAWLLARCRGAHLVLIVHGIEAWTPPSKVLA